MDSGWSPAYTKAYGMKIRILLFISVLLLPKAGTDIIPCVISLDLGVNSAVTYFRNGA